MDALKNAREEACKVVEDRLTEVEKLKENHNSVISHLGETHTAEVSKLRENYAAIVSKLEDNHAAEIFRLCEDQAAEISGIQEKQDLALVDERTSSYNEAMAEAANEVGAVKYRIYKGGYELGLESARISRDHELFGKVVLCPPGDFIIFPHLTLKKKKMPKFLLFLLLPFRIFCLLFDLYFC